MTRFRSAFRWALCCSLAFVLAVAGMILDLGRSIPQAEAATYTAASTTWGDCSFHQPGFASVTQANSLCWIDWSGVPIPNTGSAPFIRQFGNYRLTATLTRTKGPGAYVRGTRTAIDHNDAEVTSAMFGHATPNNSQGAFIPYPNDNQLSVLSFDLQGAGWDTYNRVRFDLTNIVLTDTRTNLPVTNFALTMADAEISGKDEGLSMNMGTADGVGTTWTRITAPNYAAACGSLMGTGTESGWYMSGPMARDFTCTPDTSATTGTFLATQQAPTSLTLSAWGGCSQALALAISFGRVGGSVTSDTTFEQAITGQATTFNLTAATSNGTKIPLPADGTMTDIVRAVSSDGISPSDSYIFTSAAAGQTSLAYNRYDPVWTCTVGTGSPVTIKEGAVPSGYTLTPDKTAGTSKLTYADPTNAPLDCDVRWVPKYALSSLVLGKSLAGTAAQFPSITSIGSYTLSYSCGDNGTTFSASTYAAAYPGQQLSGSTSLAPGATTTVGTLPATASCTITETLPTVPPGVNLSQDWTSTSAGANGASTTTGITATTGSAVTRSRVVTLAKAPATTTDTAVNTYDYRTGTLNVSKQLLGDPVGQFSYPRTYNFSVSCDGTTIVDQKFSLAITKQADGSYSSGAAVPVTLPVGVACFVAPLTDLSPAESLLYRFLGRTVALNGATITAETSGSHAGTYKVILADYAPNTTPTSATLALKANYDYQRRDVKVIKHLSGAAAGSPELVGKTYAVTYSCVWGATGQYSATGTVNATTNEASPVTIPNIPVGAKCTVYESGWPATTNILVKATSVSFNDMADVNTTFTNAEAQTKPIMTVQSSTDAQQNRVIITNDYEPKLATVRLTKNVVDNGIAAANLPSSFVLHFDCGKRAVVTSAGTVTSVVITGSITLTRDASGLLVASTGSSTNDALVNDQSGSLGVPYGNTCTFSEDQPTMPVKGFIWSTNATTTKLVVDSGTVSAGTAPVAITNTFTAAGNGLTITQVVEGTSSLAQPNTYTLVCKDSSGTALNLGSDASFTLSRANPTFTVPAAKLPSGSTCMLSESSTDDRTRLQADGVSTYPISRSSTVAFEDVTVATIPNPGKVATSSAVTIGDKSTLQIANTYSYIRGTITVDKNVQFDAATQKYISDERKATKYNRKFDVVVTCTPPGGGATSTATATISDYTGATYTTAGGIVGTPNAPAMLSASIPVGSTCTLSEAPTTTSSGISVTQQVAINGGTAGVNSKTWTITDTTNAAVVTNTYARQLATLQLDKIAKLPGNVAQAYADANKALPYYTHTFTVTCKDPATATPDSVVLFTTTATITGPGTATVAGIPVGADCQITGDKFGDLPLELAGADGVTLKAQLVPQQVSWVIDHEGGTALVSKPDAAGTTTSQMFTTVPNVGSTPGNIVDLVNTYGYATTTISMSKKVVATDAGFKLLDASSVVYGFNYQCRGVGYTMTTIGQGATLPGQLTLASDFSASAPNTDGTTFTRSYNSGAVTVPKDAWCTFTESTVSGTPAELELTTTPSSKTLTGYTPADSHADVATWDFVNTYTRRTVPVRLSMLQSGYLRRLDPAATYAMTVVCNDPGQTTIHATFTAGTLASGSTVADGSAPTSGQIVQLPVGANCTVSFAPPATGIDALAARSEVGVTGTAGGTVRNRRPFMEFGSWQGGTAATTNPTIPPASLPFTQVTDAMKGYTQTFALPADLQVPATSDVAMTIAAEATSLQAKGTMTLTKQVAGAVADGASYTFTADCFNGQTFTLKPGVPFEAPAMAVDTTCRFHEVNDNVAGPEPVLSVVSHGESLDVRAVENIAASTDPNGVTIPPEHSVTAVVLPVKDPADLVFTGARWDLTLKNTYPSVAIDKTIAGAGIASVVGSAMDTAVLGSTATTMDVSYAITNNGGFELTSMKLVDPSLAGMTITRNGASLVVGADGTIPASFCSLDAAPLPAGHSSTCTFTVALSSPVPSYVEIRGAVTVTAMADSQPVTATDSYGAIRPVLGLLPETGQQTLLAVLVLGLLVLGYGLWRRRRSDDDDSA